MKILLDTNFILTCIKQKIDFEKTANQIIDKEIFWLVPEQVIKEIKKIQEKKQTKNKDKESAKIALEIINNLNYEKITLEKNKNIDMAITNYLKNKEIVLATLDKNLKKRVSKNKILSIKGKNHLILTQ